MTQIHKAQINNYTNTAVQKYKRYHTNWLTPAHWLDAILFSITHHFYCPADYTPSRSELVTILSFDHLNVWSSDHLMQWWVGIKSSYLWIGRKKPGSRPQIHQRVIDWWQAAQLWKLLAWPASASSSSQSTGLPTTFLRPRGTLVVDPLSRFHNNSFPFPYLDSKLTRPRPQYTVHRTLNRINSRTFLAQFGLVHVFMLKSQLTTNVKWVREHLP